jgi:hypothetical protein
MRTWLFAIALIVAVVSLVNPPQAQQPDIAQRMAALEAEVAQLRQELALRPIWNEDRFRSSVIELLDGQKWRVTKDGLVERVR